MAFSEQKISPNFLFVQLHFKHSRNLKFTTFTKIRIAYMADEAKK